jgi:hypothetical protein
MVQYATAAQLAGYLQKDVDTFSADQVLQIASALFSSEADTMWAATSVTWSEVVCGGGKIQLPFRPVTAVSAVRVNGVAITGWTLRLNALYRVGGFGSWLSFPPDLAEVDLTHGYTAVPDDVKGAVLDTAAQAYDIPVGAVVSESIDDWAVRYAKSGGLQLTESAVDIAAGYHGPIAA